MSKPIKGWLLLSRRQLLEALKRVGKSNGMATSEIFYVRTFAGSEQDPDEDGFHFTMDKGPYRSLRE